MYDATSGEGILLPSLDMVFDAGSLAEVGPMEVAGLSPTHLSVAFEVAVGGPGEPDRCEAGLFA